MIDVTSDTSWRLTEGQLRSWLDRLVEHGSAVIAPVEVEPGLTLFGSIGGSDEALLESSGKCRFSPKEFLFPRSEALYRYTMDGASVQVADPPEPERDQVLIGVRPCDAAGLARLDDTFLSRRVDPFYRRRRERTTVVALACGGADPECFCTAVGGSPVGADGADLQLVRLEDGWLLTALKDRGQTLVADDATSWSAAEPADREAVAEIGRRVADDIACNPLLSEWSALLESGFDEASWDELAWSCLQCSACASVCPSCSCFDMNQHGTAWGGEQVRSWDGCTFELFTRHATGHNPRETRGQRYRQRVLHKFAYRDEEQDDFRCVGCGRCTAVCPAGMNILEVVRGAVEAVQGGRDGAAG